MGGMQEWLDQCRILHVMCGAISAVACRLWPLKFPEFPPCFPSPQPETREHPSQPLREQKEALLKHPPGAGIKHLPLQGPFHLLKSIPSSFVFPFLEAELPAEKREKHLGCKSRSAKAGMGSSEVERGMGTGG